MVGNKKKGKIRELVKDGLSYVFTIVSASVFPSIVNGAEMLMDTVEKRVMEVEKRIVRNVSSLVIIGFGSIFLLFALLFFLIEQLNWTKATSFFFIGIIILGTGLLLKLIDR